MVISRSRKRTPIHTFPNFSFEKGFKTLPRIDKFPSKTPFLLSLAIVMNEFFSACSAISAVKLFWVFLSVENDRFGKEIVADLFRNPQGFGKQGEMEKLSIEGGNPGFFIVQANNTAKHPVRGVERMGEANGIDPQSI
jgi:hypothetical protein